MLESYQHSPVRTLFLPEMPRWNADTLSALAKNPDCKDSWNKYKAWALPFSYGVPWSRLCHINKAAFVLKHRCFMYMKWVLASIRKCAFRSAGILEYKSMQALCWAWMVYRQMHKQNKNLRNHASNTPRAWMLVHSKSSCLKIYSRADVLLDSWICPPSVPLKVALTATVLLNGTDCTCTCMISAVIVHRYHQEANLTRGYNAQDDQDLWGVAHNYLSYPILFRMACLLTTTSAPVCSLLIDTTRLGALNVPNTQSRRSVGDTTFIRR